MCFMLCNQRALDRYKSSSICRRQCFKLLDLQWMIALLNFSPPCTTSVLCPEPWSTHSVHKEISDFTGLCGESFTILLLSVNNETHSFSRTSRSRRFAVYQLGENGLQSNPLDKISKITYVWQRLEQSSTHRRHHLFCESECCFQFLLIQFL